MASELQGKLGEGIVENILQFLGLSGSTGCLSLDTPIQEGKVFLEQGLVVHVRAGNIRDILALAAQLSWQEGDFLFDPSIPIPEKTIRLAVDKLLLKTCQSDIGDSDDKSQSRLDASSKLVSNVSQNQAETTMEVDIYTLRILPLLDGKRTLADIARESKLPLEKVLEASSRLLKKSLAQSKREKVKDEKILKLWHTAFTELEAYIKAKKLGDFQVTWSKVANALAEEHPCLDPFRPELKYTDSGLAHKISNLDSNYPKALLAVTKQLAKTYKLSRDDMSKIMKVNMETMSAAELKASGLIHLIS